jgi:hypothetical protein
MSSFSKHSAFIRYFSIMAFVFLFSACNVAYIPSMHNVPLLKKEGDIAIHLTPANVQGAYAVTNNIGVMVNGQWGGSTWEEGSTGDTQYKSRRKFAEAGIGYYSYKNEEKSFEIYGGGGIGSLSFDNRLDYTDPQKFNAMATKFFIQPSVGISKEYFDLAFAVKAVNLKFYDVNIQNYTDDDLIAKKLYRIDREPLLFIEPSFTARAGVKNIKAHFQYLYSSKISGPEINYMGYYIFLGLSIYF